jgi:hypothetical protein
LPEFIRPHTLGILFASENWKRAGLDALVTKGNVKTTKTRKLKFLTLGVWLVCLHPQFTRAAEDTSQLQSSSEGSVTSEAGNVTSGTGNVTSGGENVSSGLGKYSPLPFQRSATLREGFDNNVNDAPSGSEQQSGFTNVGADLTYSFGSARAQLSLTAGGAITYYYQRAGQQDYDLDIHAGFKLNYQLAPRLSLALDLHAAYLTEPDFSFGIGFNRVSGNYFYTADTGTLTYLWAPRFSTATSYSIIGVKYDNANVGFVEDRIENTLGNEFRFLLWPTTTIDLDYRFQTVTFTRQTGQDSITHFILGGFDHTFNPRLNITLRAGEEFRSFENGADKNGPYFESTLNYVVGKRTTLSWNSSYLLVEPNVTTNPIETAFRTGLQASQQLTSKITATLGFYYEHDHYDAVTEQFFGFTFTVSPAFSEDVYNLNLNVRYAITPHLGIDLGYDRQQVMSDIVFREFTRNRFYGGLNYAF